MTMIPVASISLFLSTEVPAPTMSGASKPSFRAGATVTVTGHPQPIVLNIDTPEEFMALCAMLQVPGPVYFNPTGQTIVKNA